MLVINCRSSILGDFAIKIVSGETTEAVVVLGPSSPDSITAHK